MYNSRETEDKKVSIYKIMYLGDIGTGKTAFIKKGVHDLFSTAYKPTIGVDFALTSKEREDDESLRSQIWDVSGQERFGQMTGLYYTGAHSATIHWDVACSGTFESVIKWYKDFFEKCAGSAEPKNTYVAFMANKLDLISDVEKLGEFDFDKLDKSSFEGHAKLLFANVNSYRRETFGRESELRLINIYLSSAKWDVAYRATVTRNKIEYSRRMTIAVMMDEYAEIVDHHNHYPQSTLKSPKVEGYQQYTLSADQETQLRKHKEKLEARWPITNAAHFCMSLFSGYPTNAKINEINHLLIDEPAKEEVVEDGTLKAIVVERKIVYAA